MNQLLTAFSVRATSAIRSRYRDEAGIMSTETAIVGAVIIAAAIAVASRFSTLFDSAVNSIPESIE